MMTQLTWSHARTVGVRAMDDQHGILLDKLNEIRLAILHGCGRECMAELIAEFTEFTLMHFHSEEALMDQTAFPGLAEHRAEHERIMKGLRDSAQRIHGEHVQMQPLLSAICNDCVHHFEGPDQLYGPWLNARGID